MAASAADFKNGDVFVGTSTGTYNVYDNGGTLLETIDQAAVAPRRSTVPLIAAACSTRPPSGRAGHPLPRAAPHTKLAAVTGEPAGVRQLRPRRQLLVGHQSNPDSLRKFGGAGTQIGGVSPARPASLIDLSADQRTVFYTDRTRPTRRSPPVRRRGRRGPPRLRRPRRQRPIADVKLLPPGDGSGGAIVAQTKTIKRVNGNGDVVAAYDRAGEDSWFGIGLDPDGRSFWAQTTAPGNVYRFNIASGAVDRGPLPSAASAFGICVKGSRTAALDNAVAERVDLGPAEGATFQQGQDVKAAFTCEDDRNGSGINRCTGTAAAGASIDTGSPGTKTFTRGGGRQRRQHRTASRTYTVAAPPPRRRRPRRPSRSSGSSSRCRATSRPSGRRRRFTRLVVKDVPRGSTVTATCRTKQGRRCRGIKTFRKRNARGTVNLKRFLRKKLRAGTVIEVRVAQRGAIGAVKRLTVRRRKNPTITTRCLPPGASSAPCAAGHAENPPAARLRA